MPPAGEVLFGERVFDQISEITRTSQDSTRFLRLFTSECAGLEEKTYGKPTRKKHINYVKSHKDACSPIDSYSKLETILRCTASCLMTAL